LHNFQKPTTSLKTHQFNTPTCIAHTHKFPKKDIKQSHTYFLVWLLFGTPTNHSPKQRFLFSLKRHTTKNTNKQAICKHQLHATIDATIINQRTSAADAADIDDDDDDDDDDAGEGAKKSDHGKSSVAVKNDE